MQEMVSVTVNDIEMPAPPPARSLMWLFALGPIEVVLVRPRFDGGRIFW